jgi:hypothetical protein
MGSPQRYDDSINILTDEGMVGADEEEEEEDEEYEDERENDDKIMDDMGIPNHILVN